MRMGSSMHRNDSAKRLQDVFFVEEEIVHILEEKNLLTKNNKENYDSMYLKSIMECLFSLSNESLSYQEKKNIMQETKEHTYFCKLLQEYKRDSITVYNRVRVFLLRSNQIAILILLDKFLKQIKNLLTITDVYFE